jgi:uncharacterized protein
LSATVVFLDASAIVKLVLPDEGSEELRAYLEARPGQVTCDVGLVETVRAVRRHGGAAMARTNAVTGALGRVVLDPAVVRMASTLPPTILRTLDAIHLSSAIGLGSALEAFVTYDRRLADAARAAGLPVVSPGMDR